MDLSDATLATFEPLVGSTFAVQLADAPELEAELVEAVQTGSETAPSQGSRRQFSLLFVVPEAGPLTQGTYRLQHPDLGEIELFLVPIHADRRGVTVEAVFT